MSEPYDSMNEAAKRMDDACEPLRALMREWSAAKRNPHLGLGWLSPRYARAEKRLRDAEAALHREADR